MGNRTWRLGVAALLVATAAAGCTSSADGTSARDGLVMAWENTVGEGSARITMTQVQGGERRSSVGAVDWSNNQYVVVTPVDQEGVPDVASAALPRVQIGDDVYGLPGADAVPVAVRLGSTCYALSAGDPLEPGRPWIGSSTTEGAGLLTRADPGDEAVVEEVDDRTLRVTKTLPEDGSGFEQETDTTYTLDPEGRIQSVVTELATSVPEDTGDTDSENSTVTFELTYSDFGIEVELEPPDSAFVVVREDTSDLAIAQQAAVAAACR